jgi:transcriptional regulator with XRE-family HTH domain
MKEEISQIVRKQVGAKVNKARRKLDLSLRELEAMTGIGHSWLSKLEKGQVNFRIESLLNLCIALKIQPKTLFTVTLSFPED